MMELPSQQYYTLRHKLDGGKRPIPRTNVRFGEVEAVPAAHHLLADLHDAGVFFLILTQTTSCWMRTVIFATVNSHRRCPAASTLYERVEREKKYSLAEFTRPLNSLKPSSQTRFSAKVDIWTVGVTVLEVRETLASQSFRI